MPKIKNPLDLDKESQNSENVIKKDEPKIEDSHKEDAKKDDAKKEEPQKEEPKKEDAQENVSQALKAPIDILKKILKTPATKGKNVMENGDPSFDRREAYETKREMNKIYKKNNVILRQVSRLIPDFLLNSSIFRWIMTNLMPFGIGRTMLRSADSRREIQKFNRRMERGFHDNPLGKFNEDPTLSPQEKAVADYKANYKAILKDYYATNGAGRFGSNFLPKSWTDTGKYKLDIQNNDEMLQEILGPLSSNDLDAMKKEMMQEYLNEKNENKDEMQEMQEMEDTDEKLNDNENENELENEKDLENLDDLEKEKLMDESLNNKEIEKDLEENKINDIPEDLKNNFENNKETNVNEVSQFSDDELNDNNENINENKEPNKKQLFLNDLNEKNSSSNFLIPSDLEEVNQNKKTKQTGIINDPEDETLNRFSK